MMNADSKKKADETKNQVDELRAEVPQPLVQAKPVTKKKLSKRTIWIGAGALLIIAIIIGSVLMNNAKNAAAQTYQTVTLGKGELIALVGATGTVHANQTTTLSWQTNGRIENINAKIGDKVAAGEELATLAQSSLSQSIILAKADLVTAQRNLDDLRNSNLAMAQAQQNLANAQNDYSDTLGTKLYSTQNRAINKDQLDAATSNVTILEDKVKKALDYYNKFSERRDDDPTKAAALNALANARQNLDIAQKNLNYYLDVPDSIEVSMADANIAVAKAKLEDAKREWNRLKDGPDPSDIAAAEARVASIQASLDLASLNAPFAGTVTELNSMVGDLVTAGTTTFRIDNLNQILVDVNVPEVDINSIKVGQTATLTFDAITDKEYSAKVSEVARVGDTIGGVVDFKVTLQILNPDAQVLPGMTAAVNITVSQLEDILTVPNRAVRLVDGKQVIYVLRNGLPVAVNIVIGASSDTTSQILSGDANVGDQVIINPATNLISLMRSQSSSNGLR
jgi:HlyD family secretion protein